MSFFNADRNDWYFGTDANPPFNKIDFVSVALHELGHGLGFIGSARIDSDNNGYVGYDYPFMYDVFVDNNVGNPILDLPSPSPAIYSLLTGGNNSLRFDDTNHSYFRDPQATFALHTPAVYNAGSSYSHFSEALLGDELMSPTIGYEEAIHQVDAAEIVLKEIGWNYIALPIQLISFDVITDLSDVNLTWKTDYEFNNDHFDVERSVDGLRFDKIGEIAAIAERSTIKSYQFKDINPQEGINYYRLKQVDFDESFSYSDIKLANFSKSILTWRLGPNPLTQNLIIHTNENDAGALLTAYDASGKVVKTFKNIGDGQSLDVSDINPGILFFNLSLNDQNLGWQKLIKN